ncbi:hypothetical protein ACFQ0T_01090 [Kitasatospora gansuensis]
MSSTRRTASVAGVLFLITEVAAIAGLLLYGPALAGYVVAPGRIPGCSRGRCARSCWCWR